MTALTPYRDFTNCHPPHNPLHSSVPLLSLVPPVALSSRAKHLQQGHVGHAIPSRQRPWLSIVPPISLRHVLVSMLPQLLRDPLSGLPALVLQDLDQVDEHGARGQLDAELLDRGERVAQIVADDADRNKLVA